MRTILPAVKAILDNPIQTKADNSALSTNLWISRPVVPLVYDTFLEKQVAVSDEEASITDASIAVCHPKFGFGSTKIDIAYIKDGYAKVTEATAKAKMKEHDWHDRQFNEAATAVAIAYDGTMRKSVSGIIEFITELEPWIFWVNDGQLYTRKLGTDTTIVLTEENCTDVSAVRATWSDAGGFDFGLIAFFIVNGQLYYRQRIDGEWYDAETITFGPSGVSYVEVSASRTADYRIALQCKTTDGEIYELFTQYQGFAKQLTENVVFTNISAKGTRTALQRHDMYAPEHVEINDISGHGLIQWGSQFEPSNVINVFNGSDYGRLITVTFPHPIDVYSITDDLLPCITLTDSENHTWQSKEITSVTFTSFTVRFTNFNGAIGNLTLHYDNTELGIMFPPIGPDTKLDSFDYEFTPVSLDPSLVHLPTVVEVTNI